MLRLHIKIYPIKLPTIPKKNGTNLIDNFYSKPIEINKKRRRGREELLNGLY